MISFLVIIILSLSSYSYINNDVIIINIDKPVIIDIRIISKIESNNNNYAYNKSSKAYGAYQITPICLADYNKCLGADIEYSQLSNELISREIAFWYLNYRIPAMLENIGADVTIENVLWCYNAGIGRLHNNIKPSETKLYVIKYRTHIDNFFW